MPKPNDQVMQEIYKELFRLRLETISVPKKRVESNGMNHTIFEKLLINELAKNKTLTQASKQELREEDWGW